MKDPAVTVAMSVYNAAPYVGEAIDSILAQGFTDFEFLIVNDGSSDGSAALIDDYAARDARIRVMHQDNRGFVASLNRLLEEARAPLVARMDADDVSLPERFARQVAFLRDNPACGVVGSRTIDIDSQGAPYTVSGTEHPTTHEELLAAAREQRPLICHPSVMFRRDVVRSVGGYHAAFRHCEDLDLWLRLASVTRLANLPERLIRYRHYAGQVSSRHATEQLIGANVALLAWEEREAGRPDPTAALDRLPPIDGLDALFGRSGVSRYVRERVAPELLYVESSLRDEGFHLILSHVRDGGGRDGMWRTVARLVRLGEPLRAARLAATLATS